MQDDLDDYSDSEFAEEFVNRLGINSFDMQLLVKNRSLACTIKLEAFISNYNKFTIEQFEQFLNTLKP